MKTAAETDVLDPPADPADENLPVDPPSDDTPPAEDPPADPPADEDDDVIVTIGEESPPSEEEENRAPEWVRELRKTNREKDREIRELRQMLEAQNKPAKAAELGAKPTLEDCDYDTDKFESELAAWHERKRAAEAKEEEKRKADEEAQAAWNAKQEAYKKARTELKVKDFDDAEETVLGTLNVTQQGVILHGAENPALLVYALGKNPKKAKELASITDPVKFAFAVAKLETQLKVTPRKAAPAPEKTVRGSAPVSGAVDSTLERLRAEAAKTGDFTKVHQYKRQQREKQK